MRDFIIRRFGLLIAGALLGSLLFGAAAHSTTLKTGYYSIDPMALAPQSVSSTVTYRVDYGEGITNVSDEEICFHTGLNLPDRATITKVILWYSNGHTSSTTSTAIMRNEYSRNGGAFVALGGLNPTASQRRALTLPLDPTRAKIDNLHFSYGFTVCQAGMNKEKFFGARIVYTYLD